MSHLKRLDKNSGEGWAGSKNINWGTGAVTQSTQFANYLQKGSLPAKYMGYSSGWGWKDLAHEQQKINKLNNLLNNDVDEVVQFKVFDANGRAKTLPFKMYGKEYRPDPKSGLIRITDSAKPKQLQEIAKYRKEKVDRIMQKLEDLDDGDGQIGDEIVAYLTGLDKEKEWERMCTMPGEALKKEFGINFSKSDDWDVHCTLVNIAAEPPKSRKQSYMIAKLRKLIQYLEPRINEDALSGLDEMKENMEDGRNVNKADLGERAKLEQPSQPGTPTSAARPTG